MPLLLTLTFLFGVPFLASAQTVEPPTDVIFTGFTDSQISMSWTPPDNGTPIPVYIIEGYDIRYQEDGDDWVTINPPDPTTDDNPAYIHIGLKPDTIYNYGLSTCSVSSGCSVWTTDDYFQETLATTPSNCTGVASGENAITWSWGPGANDSGQPNPNSVDYYVTTTVGEPDSGWINGWSGTPPDPVVSLSWVQTGLDCNTGHSATVKARGSANPTETTAINCPAVTTDPCESDPPVLDFSPTSQGWTNANIDVTIDATDATGISVIDTCSTTGSTCTPNADTSCGGSTSCEATVSLTSNGSWNVCAYSEDTITDTPKNNTGTVCSGRYEIDKTNPSVTDFLVNGQTKDDPSPILDTDTNLSIDWQVSDTGGSGIHQVEIWRYSGTCAAAVIDFWAGANIENVTIDGSAPGPGTDSQIGHSYSTGGSGTFCLGLHVTDHATNWVDEGSEGPLEVIVDTTPPTINITPGSQAWTNSAFNVTIDVTDTLSGIDTSSLQYCWTTGVSCSPITAYIDNSPISITSAGQGSWTICADAADQVGNSASTCQGTYQYDTTPPAVDYVAIGNYALGTIVNAPGQPQVQWSVFTDSLDGLSPMASVTLQRATGVCPGSSRTDLTQALGDGSGGDKSGSFSDTTVPQDGDYCYGVEVQDEAGNTAIEVTPGESADVEVDATPPTLTFNPSTQAAWGKTPIAVTTIPSDSDIVDNNIDGVNLCWVDGALGSTTCDPTTGTPYLYPGPIVSGNSISPSPLSSGSGNWYMCARAQDGALNWGAIPSGTGVGQGCTGPYNVDVTAPTATITQSNPACEEVQWDITSIVEQHSGTSRTDGAFSYDNGLTWTTATTFNRAVPGGGSVQETVIIRDNADNQTSYLQPTILIGSCDVDPPEITYTIKTRAWANSDVIETVTGTEKPDATPGNVLYMRACTTSTGTSCTVTQTDANTSEFTCDGTSLQCAGNVTLSTTGEWYICAIGKDDTVNENWTSPAECSGPYQVDKTGPTANFIGDGSTCDQITWAVQEATDADAGVHDTLAYSFDDGVTPNWQFSNTSTESFIGGGTFQKTVRVRDNAGAETTQLVQATTVQCNQNPEDPTNLWQSPGVEGASTSDGTPYFLFDIEDRTIGGGLSGDTIGYNIQIATDAGFASRVIDFTWDGAQINPQSVRFDVPSSCATQTGPDWRYHNGDCTTPLPTGNYYWRVQAIDQSTPQGISNWVTFLTAAVDFSIDTTPPSVSVGGATGSWQSGSASATVVCNSGDCAAGTSKLKQYASDPGTCSTTYSAYLDNPPQTVTSNVWYCAAAQDAAGNTGFSVPAEFLVESTAPSITITGAPGAWQTSSANIDISCLDSGGSGCDSSTYRFYTTSVDTTVCSSVSIANYTLTTPQTMTGHTYACATGADNAGNRAYSNLVEILIDTTAPTATFSSDNATCDEITWSITNPVETDSGLDPTGAYSFDGGSAWTTSNTFIEVIAGGGPSTRTLQIRDAAGNVTSSGPIADTATSCNQAPLAPVNLTQSPGTEGAQTSDTTPYFEFTIEDSVGDTHGYTIQIANNTGFTSPVIDYTWPGSTIAQNSVRYDVPSALAEGTYYWRVQGRDQAGLTSAWVEFGASGVADFVVDTTAPSQPTCSPVGGVYTATQFVDLTSTGSNRIRYNIDTAAPTDCNAGTSYTGTITVTNSQTINAIGCDAADNISSAASCAYSIGSIPNTTISTAPPDPTALDSGTFTFTGTNSPTSFECQLDGGGWSTCSSGQSYASLSEGDHTFEVRAINGFGTDATPASYTWRADLVDPQVTSYNIDGNTVTNSPFVTANTNPQINWAVLDPGVASGLLQAEIWRYGGTCAAAAAAGWSGADVQTVIIDASYPGPVSHADNTIQGLADGTYCYGHHAVDHVARWSDEGSLGPIEVTVDTNLPPDAPTNMAQSPGIEGVTTGDSTPSFDFTISDPNPGDTVGYQIQIATNASFSTRVIDYTWGGVAISAPSNVTFSMPSTCPGTGYTTCNTSLSDGIHFWRVRTIDGDSTQSAWVEFGVAGVIDFTVDTSVPPTPTCTPAGGNYGGSLSVTLDSTGADQIRYTVDSPAPTTCSEGTQYTGAINIVSSATVNAIACSAIGLTSGTATCAYNIGSVPQTVLDSWPDNPTNATGATFGFSGTNSPTGFQCKLDPSANQNTTYTSCTSPNVYTSINQGTRIFTVYAENIFGDDAGSPETYQWLIDTTHPKPAAVAGFSVDGNTVGDSPVTTINQSPTIAWDVSDAGGSGLFDLEIWRYSGTCTAADAASWVGANIQTVTLDSDGDRATYPGPLTSASSVSQTVSEGTYCYGLHVNDNATNCITERGNDCGTSSPVSGAPTVGPIELSIDINTQPLDPYNLSQSPGFEGASTNDNTPQFFFTIEDPEAGDTVGYQIQIATDSGFATNVIDYAWPGSTNNPFPADFQVPATCPVPLGDYSTCTAPLADGTYWWRVRTSDQASPPYSSWIEFQGAGADFTVDTAAPPKPTCTPGDQSFTTSVDVTCSNTDASATIFYTLDGGSVNQYIGTLSFTQTTVLEVWAEDAVGNSSATPHNSYTYTRGDLPNTVIDTQPSDPLGSSSATFEFSGTNSPTSFECQLDGGGFATCSSPNVLSSLSDGSHTFEVRAVNAFGTDPSPASYTWTIDTQYPDSDTGGLKLGLSIDGFTLSDAPFTLSNTSPQVSYDTRDLGNAGLQDIEIWRYTGTCADADAASWAGANVQNVFNDPAYPGPGTVSGNTIQTLSDNTYCYGMHIIDHIGLCITERGEDCATATPVAGRTTVGPVEVTINSAATGTFTVSTSPATRSVAPSGVTTYTVTLTPFNGYNNNVSLSVSGLPANTSSSFGPTSCTPSCTSILTITTTGATPGVSTLTITGDDGTLTDNDAVDLDVNASNTTPNDPRLCGPDDLTSCNTY